jgi:hypothetical protein
MRHVKDALVVFAVALATHLDWHAARPTVHHLSLGLPWHWLLAVPLFALTAWYVARAWPARRLAGSVAILGLGIFVGAVVEPAWEYWIDGAEFEWAFGTVRNTAALQFTAAGLVSYVAALLVLGHGGRGGHGAHGGS